ncbi:unnamed protein product, partial [Ectocarpus sp. 13 AM-2016]
GEIVRPRARLGTLEHDVPRRLPAAVSRQASKLRVPKGSDPRTHQDMGGQGKGETRSRWSDTRWAPLCASFVPLTWRTPRLEGTFLSLPWRGGLPRSETRLWRSGPPSNRTCES